MWILLITTLLTLISDGNAIAVASHDNYIYVYSVSEDGRKYTKVGKCTVSVLLTLYYFTVDYKFHDNILRLRKFYRNKNALLKIRKCIYLNCMRQSYVIW